MLAPESHRPTSVRVTFIPFFLFYSRNATVDTIKGASALRARTSNAQAPEVQCTCTSIKKCT